MAVDSSDMLVTHLASWARRQDTTGGLFGQLQANLSSFPVKFPKQRKMMIADDDYLLAVSGKNHGAVVKTLFGEVSLSRGLQAEHVKSLKAEVRGWVDPVIKDRDENRAHAFEAGTSSADRLRLGQDRALFSKLRCLLNDLRLLADWSTSSYHELTKRLEEEQAEEWTDSVLMDRVLDRPSCWTGSTGRRTTRACTSYTTRTLSETVDGSIRTVSMVSTTEKLEKPGPSPLGVEIAERVVNGTVSLERGLGQGVLVRGGFILTAAHCVPWGSDDHRDGGLVHDDHLVRVSAGTVTGVTFELTPCALDPFVDLAVLTPCDGRQTFDGWVVQTQALRLRTSVPTEPLALHVRTHLGSGSLGRGHAPVARDRSHECHSKARNRSPVARPASRSLTMREASRASFPTLSSCPGRRCLPRWATIPSLLVGARGTGSTPSCTSRFRGGSRCGSAARGADPPFGKSILSALAMDGMLPAPHVSSLARERKSVAANVPLSGDEPCR